MDQSAILLARDFQLPLHVFNFDQPGSMKRICLGENVGTFIDHQVATRLVEHVET
jgi:uridylate kinase